MSGSSGEAIVAIARSWIGTPYIHQTSLKNVGCDCLGLLRGIWRERYGFEPCAVPAYSSDWAEATGKETLSEAAHKYFVATPASAISQGCVVLFRWRDGLPAKHCAIATSASTMIHAHDGACVAEVAIGSWWRRHLVSAHCFPEL
jgi:NlpC/P60 family putative phage cell wall peptidase